MRYAKRSVMIDGRQYNAGDIIPAFVTDEAAKAAHAFEDATVTIDAPVEEEEEIVEAPVADPDEETFDVEVPGADLLMQSATDTPPAPPVETVAPVEPEAPVAPAKGKRGLFGKK